MLISKFKLILTTLFLLFTALTVPSTYACEALMASSWYHLKITPFLPELPPTLEIKVQEQNAFGQDSLILTNNSSTSIYIVRDMTVVKDLQSIYDASMADDNPSEWVAQLDKLGATYASVPPRQTQYIYNANYRDWSEVFAKWPEDFGGRRPNEEVTFPEPRSNGLALVHYGGVHTIPFSESIVLNAHYPEKEYWHGCPEEYYEEPMTNQAPVLIATEENSVSQDQSFQLFWLFTGALLLGLAAWGINKWNQTG